MTQFVIWLPFKLLLNVYLELRGEAQAHTWGSSPWEKEKFVVCKLVYKSEIYSIRIECILQVIIVTKYIIKKKGEEKIVKIWNASIYIK